MLFAGSCQKLEIERELKIETDSVFDIKTKSAVARATIKDIGSGIVSYGHLWDTIPMLSFSSNASKQIELKTQGEFDTKMEGLVAGKVYYYMAYAIDINDKYVFSMISEFTTFFRSNPLVATGDIIKTDPYEITIEGQIIDLGIGEDSILAYGHCFSTISNPLTRV